MQPPSRHDPRLPAGNAPHLPAASACRELLPGDVRTDWPRSSGAVRAAWHGVVWSRLARGDQAWAWWDAALDRPDVRLPDAAVTADRTDERSGPPPRRLGPWIAAERGRCLRELGLHRAAEELERSALQAAEDPVDAAMLRVSLVADAVGLGRIDHARERLDGARRAVVGLPDGPRAARQRLRLAWVDVEVALLTDSIPPSAGVPGWDAATGGPQLPADHVHGSRFHTAKGLLFGAVVHDDARLLVAAADLAPPVLRWAVWLALADRGVDGAEDEARAAWRAVVPPPGFEVQVAASPTGLRLT